MSEFANNFLVKIIKDKHVAHLLLFIHGAEEATIFAKKWLQSITAKKLVHFSDFHVLKVEGKTGMHSIDACRQLIEKASMSPYEASGKVFLIHDAERMLPSAANALLKIVEEPPPQTIIILLTNEPEKILPTIRSRAQCVRFRAKKMQDEKRVSQGMMTLQEIAAASEKLASILEKQKARIEKELNKIYEPTFKEISAKQREQLEHEIEGQIANRNLEEVKKVLATIGATYRDRASDKTLEALSWAKLAIERSTPLENVFQSLFFQLEAERVIA